jgi:phage-related protein
MSFSTFSPPIPPSPTSTRVDRTPNAKVSQFGDGYAQRSIDGTNVYTRVATLQWDVLDLAELTSMYSYLDGLAGVSAFYWTPFGESTHVLFELDWTSAQQETNTPINAQTFMLRVVLREVFDI